MTSPASIIPYSTRCVCGDPACLILYRRCHCGCGTETILAPLARKERGLVRGMPHRYAPHHLPRKNPALTLKRPKHIPYGHCWCGCGLKTGIAKRTVTSWGEHKGQPRCFYPGHCEFVPNRISFAVYEGREVVLIHSESLNSRLPFVIIDFDDLDRVIRYRWGFANRYATTKLRVGAGRSKAVPLHDFICGKLEGKTWDHANRRPWDNRRCNLRPANRKEQAANSNAAHKYGFRGIRWKKNGWEVGCAGEYIGRFGSGQKEDAARAYDAAARRHFGEFAVLNFPTTSAPAQQGSMRDYLLASRASRQASWGSPEERPQELLA